MHERDTEESANIRRFSRYQRLLHDIKDAETEAQAHCRLESHQRRARMVPLSPTA